MPRLKHLTEYHKKALSLKYKGTEYSEIADTLNQLFPRARPGKDFTEPLVKNWFREGGTLCEEFRKYEIEWDAINKKLVLESKKAGIQTLGKNSRLACEMLVALMGRLSTKRFSSKERRINPCDLLFSRPGRKAYQHCARR